MDVEVEVVREQRQTLLVVGARSLADAESVALEWAQERRKPEPRVPRHTQKDPEWFVTWSHPVRYRDGKIYYSDGRVA